MITTGPRNSGLILLRCHLQARGWPEIAVASSAPAWVVSALAPVTTDPGHVAVQSLKSGVNAWPA
jgi:hypothetical protein